MGWILVPSDSLFAKFKRIIYAKRPASTGADPDYLVLSGIKDGTILGLHGYHIISDMTNSAGQHCLGTVLGDGKCNHITELHIVDVELPGLLGFPLNGEYPPS